MMKPVNCPACKSDKYVRPYDLPEAIVRERELRAELNKTYAAYGKAAEKNLPMPSGLRPPGDIMKDLQALPRLFLVAEPGKVKQFEAFTAPVGAGLGGASTP
jgi:hypothetical protein